MRSERNLVMIPGPTNVDPSVLRALGKPTVSHVSSDFAEVFKESLKNLSEIFITDGIVFAFAGSGTLAAEMAVANVLEPSDQVLAVCNGFFGERLAEICTRYGGRVEKEQLIWDRAADPAKIEQRLEEGNFKLLTIVHVDTSTGIANPIEKIGKVAKAHDVTYLVDTVCSLGGMEVRVRDWNIDLCFSGSQKAIAIPPGMGFVAVSEKALKIRSERKAPPNFYYLDFLNWIPIMKDPTRYFATPPVNMIYALQEATKQVLQEGLEERFRRHKIFAKAFRAAMRALGLRVLAAEEEAASTMTVVYYPEGIDDVKFRAKLLNDYGITVAGGLGQLKGQVFRVGHMGNVNANDIAATVTAIEQVMIDMGYRARPGTAMTAAAEILGLESK